jgi:hypothetical protein
MLKTFFLSVLVFAQTVHVSFTGLSCFPEKGLIKVFLKMNYNDFIFDYRVNINDDQNFNFSEGIDTSEILVSKYLASKLQVFADDKELRGQLTNIEFVNNELNMNLIYHFSKRAISFKVKNTILTKLNKNPSNLVIFKCDDFEEGVKLAEEKTEHTFIVK